MARLDGKTQQITQPMEQVSGGDTSRTMLAQQGFGLIDVFNAAIGRLDVSSHRPLLREPPAHSTGGGRQAMQHIVLLPPDPSASVLTVGSLNVATRQARIRTYECLLLMHRQRFGDRVFTIAPDRYQAFFDTLRRFFESQQLRVEIETKPPIVSIAPPGEAGLSRALVVALAILAILVFAILLLYALNR
ncbi:MAG: hypothetical protein AAGA56_14570 [Myxococcota bacterium]